jgi:hypothetical protein
LLIRLVCEGGVFELFVLFEAEADGAFEADAAPASFEQLHDHLPPVLVQSQQTLAFVFAAPDILPTVSAHYLT